MPKDGGRGMIRKMFAMVAAALLATAAPALAETWTIGLYLCGSDLESRAGAGTSDMLEAIEADLSDEVNFVVMTGGSIEWQNDVVDANKLQIWKLVNNDFELLSEMPARNMGDPDTLASFLRFLRENFPADKRAFFMWNHGGGSAGGISYDERFNSDSVSLLELSSALYDSFDGTFDPANDKFFDLFGFDACLMATIDTASAIMPYAKYMVASQNLEPGNGWQYTYLLSELSRNTSIDGAALGRIVCDSFLAGCRDEGTDDGATLSVIDLGKIKLLRATYDLLGIDAFSKARSMGNGFYSQWARSANDADNYMNSKSEGFTNMVDLGGLVANMRDILPEGAEATLEVLDQAVIYKVSGGEFPLSSGLSCYYPFDNSEETWRKMLMNETSAFNNILAGLKVGADVEKDYYDSTMAYIINNCEEVMQELQEEEAEAQSQQQAPAQGGLLSQIAAAASAAQSVSAPSAIEAFDVTKLEDHPIEITNDGEIKIDLGSEVMENIEDVLFNLCYYSEDDDVMMILGSDAGLNGDWERGVFTDNFSGNWMAIDDHLMMTEVTYYGQEMIRYAVPIILNGKRCALQMIYDFKEEEYVLIGAREQRDSDSPPDKILLHLKPGDEISTLCLARKMSADEDEDFQEVAMETFKLSDGFKVEETDMGDGKFMFMFEMRDIQGNSAYSSIAGIEVANGEITVMEL